MAVIGIPLRYNRLEDGRCILYLSERLRRTIQNLVEDRLAEEILDGRLDKGKLAKFTVKDGKMRQVGQS